MKTLSTERWESAKAWLYAAGRPLDRRLYETMFEGGPATAVVAELAHYQNADGGFGHGLEPDLRSASSSVIATTQAFDLLRRVQAGPDVPLVRRGIEYYVAHYDPAGRRWAMATAAVEEAPHAPWWSYEALARTFREFHINPTAAVVGHLLDYPQWAPQEMTMAALAATLARMAEQPDPLPRDDLMCLIGLSEARGLDEAARRAVEARIEWALPAAVTTDPGQWTQYCLTPLDVAPAPGARFAGCFDRQTLEHQLDWWIETQAEDGTWPLTWSWAQVDAEAWAEAERAWKGRVLVERLAVLAAYGRAEV